MDNIETPILLIIDYNLSRITDVQKIVAYARYKYNAKSILIRPNPTDQDYHLCEHVIDLNPLDDYFLDQALIQLAPWKNAVKAGIVFSDNAVQSGAELLEKLNLKVDSSKLANAAFCKFRYRERESASRELLEAQSVFVPDYQEISHLEDLEKFSIKHPDGFVVKPKAEGNNRGVVVVQKGDDLQNAFGIVEPYLAFGAICEEFIAFNREFSFDGVGETYFITEKVSASGKYPVEVAQILPARLSEIEEATIVRTGRLVNLLIGQKNGAFHNEIKLNDDGSKAAVVEPNRRPAGMKIWTIAEAVYGIDFYGLWIDSAFGILKKVDLKSHDKQAATVMLSVAEDGVFNPPDLDVGLDLFEQALKLTAEHFHLKNDALTRLDFGWLMNQPRYISQIPKDNSDFAAQACFSFDKNTSELNISQIVHILREKWLAVSADFCLKNSTFEPIGN